MHTILRIDPRPSLFLALCVGLIGCPGGGDDDDATNDTLRLGDQVLRVWAEYEGCPGGCAVTEEDLEVLEEHQQAFFFSPSVPVESHDVLEELAAESEALGIHPIDFDTRSGELTTSSDPRMDAYFRNGDGCLVVDEMNGDPLGTLVCTDESGNGNGARWLEPTSKTAAAVALAAVAACEIRWYTCQRASTTAYRGAPELCAPPQTLNRACSRAIYLSHWDNCAPCGGSPNILDHQTCCR